MGGRRTSGRDSKSKPTDVRETGTHLSRPWCRGVTPLRKNPYHFPRTPSPDQLKNTNTGLGIPDRNANLFDSIDAFIYWHNLLKLYLSFNFNEGEMPHLVFRRKFPAEQILNILRAGSVQLSKINSGYNK
jgi:hypothetical protein